MFHHIEPDSFHKSVAEARLADLRATENVMSALLDNYDFGHGFFHKILNKSILRPGTLSKQAPARTSPEATKIAG